MLTATFHRHSADARGQLEARAAQNELRKASESLRQLLSYEGQYSKNTVALIDDAIKRLQRLRRRVEKHSELLKSVREGEEKIAEHRERTNRKLDQVEKEIAETTLERVSILTQCDEIRRDILVAKRTLEEQQKIGESESEECGIASVRIETLCGDAWDAMLDATDADAGTKQLP